MAALRFNPLSFARFIGDPWNAVLNSSCVIARSSRARVCASLPAIAVRGAAHDGSVTGTPGVSCLTIRVERPPVRAASADRI